MAERTVDGYIAGLEDWQGEIVSGVRNLILDLYPDVKESIKWAQPVFEHHGPFAYIKAFNMAVNFGFWRGAELDDPQVLLQGSGEKMRHLKLKTNSDINDHDLMAFIRQAYQLNEIEGDPTKGG